eukprot:7787857-Pyramimonas_sp.AAC.3
MQEERQQPGRRQPGKQPRPATPLLAYSSGTGIRGKPGAAARREWPGAGNRRERPKVPGPAGSRGRPGAASSSLATRLIERASPGIGRRGKQRVAASRTRSCRSHGWQCDRVCVVQPCRFPE